jgi:hypothetical protein
MGAIDAGTWTALVSGALAVMGALLGAANSYGRLTTRIDSNRANADLRFGELAIDIADLKNDIRDLRNARSAAPNRR